jgi:hypothetical protein
MIERYFRSGVRFLWRKPPDNTGGGGELGAIVPSTGGATPLIYDGLDGHPAAIDPLLPRNTNAAHVIGIAKGANVPYAWLDYAPGRTARRAIGGSDILTGRMSGCLIARGVSSGAMSAFHLGTVTDDEALNRTVKQDFGGALPQDVTGFFPDRAWSEGEVAITQGRLGGNAGAAAIFGLITAAGTFHSILMFQVEEPGVGWTTPAGQHFWCVGGIKAVPALTRIQVGGELLR